MTHTDLLRVAPGTVTCGLGVHEELGDRHCDSQADSGLSPYRMHHIKQAEAHPPHGSFESLSFTADHTAADWVNLFHSTCTGTWLDLEHKKAAKARVCSACLVCYDKMS